jgi:hypothetical protein
MSLFTLVRTVLEQSIKELNKKVKLTSGYVDEFLASGFVQLDIP